MALIALAAQTGCDSEFAKEFRAAATPAIHSGVSSIVDGLLDGIFAVMDPDTSGTTP